MSDLKDTNIFRAKVKPGAKVLYFYLKENPGTGMTTQSINAYVQELDKAGWLRVEDTPHTRQFTYSVR
jgi:hypothetical protein